MKREGRGDMRPRGGRRPAASAGRKGNRLEVGGGADRRAPPGGEREKGGGMVGRWDGLAGPRRKEERGGRDVGWAGKREERSFLLFFNTNFI